MKFLISFLLFTNLSSAAPTISLFDCEKSGDVEALARMHKLIEQHDFFRFAKKRSSLISCKFSEKTANLKFNRNDEIEINLNDPAPSSEMKFGSPIKEQRAFRLVARVGSSNCSLPYEKPTQQQDDAKTGGKIKTYWCTEIRAVSVTSNKNGEAIAVRSWIIH